MWAGCGAGKAEWYLCGYIVAGASGVRTYAYHIPPCTMRVPTL